MKYRKLRVAWSVFWGIAAMLLIVLWVRSYGRLDSILYSYGKDNVGIESRQGNLLPFFQPYGGSQDKWRFNSHPIVVPFSGFEHTPLSLYNRLPYSSAAIPYWFLVLIITAIATVTWIKWPSRFSLRTLIIATTLVAVVLGAIVYAVR